MKIITYIIEILKHKRKVQNERASKSLKLLKVKE